MKNKNKTKFTRAVAIQQLKMAALDDPESGHMAADAVLCKLLTRLGYADVVNEFEKIQEWYA